MSDLIPVNEVSILHETLPVVQEKYPLKLTQLEVGFLRNFSEWMVQNWTDPTYVLELACLNAIGRRFKARFLDPTDCTLTLYPFEAIALKRLLWAPPLPDRQINNTRNIIFGKLDQMMIGIQ